MFAECPEVDTQVPTSPLWHVRDMLYGIALLLMSLLVVTGVTFLLHDLLGTTSENADAVIAVSTIAFELMFAAAVLMLALRRGLRFVDLGFVRPQHWSPTVIACVGAYGILFVYGVMLDALEVLLGVDVAIFEMGNRLPDGFQQSVTTLLLFGIAVIVVAPFSEELFFRGLLFRGMRGYWRLVPSLVASGLGFALFHVNVAVVLPFAFIGVLFAWANEQTGSLWTSIVAHATFNGISFVATVAFVTR